MMKSLSSSLVPLLSALCLSCGTLASGVQSCRNVPGSPGYPTTATWSGFNATISGRLIDVVPSAKYCANLPGGSCTDAQWTSHLFRTVIPGAMDAYNFEQGYDLSPPTLCLRNGTTCGQGNVPIYSVEAKTVEDIQAAVIFAGKHNLRVAVKASGHDNSGRSTAPKSLLIRTTHLTNVTFITDSFLVGSQSMGSAVTLGSGVMAKMLYRAGRENGKAVVGGSSASVCMAGGYVQGAGHSSLSPLLGLAADNALVQHCYPPVGNCSKSIVISHPDLFYAVRGGGAGSWGVVIAVTFRTFPTFNATTGSLTLAAADNTAASAVARIHAEHIFDLDSVSASHAFIVSRDSIGEGTSLTVSGIFPNVSTSESKTLLGPFLSASLSVPGVSSLVSETYSTSSINDALYQEDDAAGANAVLGSRLIPTELYRRSPAKVGMVYKQLLDTGTTMIIENVVGGGRVAENAKIPSAIHPAWRTAKNHIIIANLWSDSASLREINAVRKKFQTQQLSILEKISGPNAGAYSNEADGMEPDFMTTFFGPNYAKLSAIKRKYDPKDLFIVTAGVGSERWDQWGICKV
ncbi:FAD-binding domain-containing protein [Mycena rebaudengoi]|nr:FAD-binding domain-containing protein [Mycena rebaudengoi]